MGTNYYTIGERECDSCGEGHACRRGIHLGKSSGGWKFTFQWNGGHFYKSEPEMREWLKGKIITDEYGLTVSYDDFWAMVDAKKDAELDFGRPEYSSERTYIVDGVVFSDGEFS